LVKDVAAAAEQQTLLVVKGMVVAEAQTGLILFLQQYLVQVELMAAEVVVYGLLLVVVAVLAVMAQSVLFGQDQHVHSHQLALAILN
jgi:hypothetical protein